MKTSRGNKRNEGLFKAAVVLRNSEQLRGYAEERNNASATDTLVKNVFLELFPNSPAFLSNFRVTKVSEQEIVIATSSSAFFCAMRFRSPELRQALGKKIVLRIMHYDNETLINPIEQ